MQLCLLVYAESDKRPDVTLPGRQEPAAHPAGSTPLKSHMTLPTDPTPVTSRKDSLIEFPSRFPIKVMGANVNGFVHAVTELAHRFDPDFDASTIELRDSRAGNYLGVTITITATSQQQLDDLYRALTSHPMVKVVL